MAYRLVLHDDPDHTFQYVHRLLTEDLGLASEAAASLTLRVHAEGTASIEFADLAAAQAAQERVFSAGPDPLLSHSDGSLVASVEEVTVRSINCGRVAARGYERVEAAALRANRERSLRASQPGAVRVAARSRCCAPVGRVESPDAPAALRRDRPAGRELIGIFVAAFVTFGVMTAIGALAALLNR